MVEKPFTFTERDMLHLSGQNVSESNNTKGAPGSSCNFLVKKFFGKLKEIEFLESVFALWQDRAIFKRSI